MAPPSSSSSSLSSFDDSDWEFTNIDENDSVSDAEWVITGDDIYYVSGRSVAGVIFPFNKKPSIISFQSNSSSSSSLVTTSVPPLFPVSASSKGLVLSRGPWSSYLVSNPSTGAHAFLPKPPGPHKSGSPLALTQSGSTYHVICGLAGTCKDSYTFSTFSSTMGTWSSSRKEFALGHIIANTGVSCGSFAYWRTESQMAVEYNVLADQARLLMPPRLSEGSDRWQLGRAGDKLCCVVVSGSNLEVYEWGAKDRWMLLCSVGIVVSGEEDEEEEEWDGGEPIVCRRFLEVLRFESHELEVLLVVDDKLVVLMLENRKMRVVKFEKRAPDCYDEFVPFIDDPLASVDFSVPVKIV